MDYAVVLEVVDIGYTCDEFVYDLETDSGTFSTGDGIILKNTDSCYVKFSVDRKKFPEDESHAFMKEHFRLAEECAQKITETFKPPIELEFEKVMYPFLLLTKKRYAYLEWLCPEKYKGIDFKGLHLARRDNCQYIRHVSMKLLNSLLVDKDVEKAKKEATESVVNLLSGGVDTKDLVISKSLNKYYKVGGVERIWYDANVPQPQVKLAQKLRLLDPTGHPKPPDRVPYLFIESKDPSVLQYERVEHPDYLDGKKIDYFYYLEKQLITPVDSIMELVMDDPTVLYTYERQKYLNIKNGYGKGITDYFKVVGDGDSLSNQSSQKKKKKKAVVQKKKINDFFKVSSKDAL